MPEGIHNLKVSVDAESYYVLYEYSADPEYAITVHGASEVITFKVKDPDSPEPFPTAVVATSLALVAVIGVGLLVYFKKRHAKSGDKA